MGYCYPFIKYQNYSQGTGTILPSKSPWLQCLHWQQARCRARTTWGISCKRCSTWNQHLIWDLRCYHVHTGLWKPLPGRGDNQRAWKRVDCLTVALTTHTDLRGAPSSPSTTSSHVPSPQVRNPGVPHDTSSLFHD